MQGKKPTFEQRKLLTKHKLDTYKWLVQKDSPDKIQLINKDTGEIITIKKSA